MNKEKVVEGAVKGLVRGKGGNEQRERNVEPNDQRRGEEKQHRKIKLWKMEWDKGREKNGDTEKYMRRKENCNTIKFKPGESYQFAHFLPRLM